MSMFALVIIEMQCRTYQEMGARNVVYVMLTADLFVATVVSFSYMELLCYEHECVGSSSGGVENAQECKSMVTLAFT